MNPINFVLLVAVWAAVSGQAQAQSYQAKNRQLPDDYISVQSALTITAPLADTNDSKAPQEKALRSFYQLVAGSCPMLLETVADACEVVAMNSNTDTVNRSERGPMLTIRGQISMAVKLKSSIGSPKSAE